ncbi:MAG: hypothetical protein ACT4QD_21780 [Acidobacteriota bacterium]
MLSRRSAVAALGLAALGAACRGAPEPAGREVSSLDQVAERYVRLTLRLAQHQPSLVEAWLGPEAWRPGPREPVAGIREELFAIRRAIAALTPEQAVLDRSRYLEGQIDALLTAARRLSGESSTWSDEAATAMGLGEIEFARAGLAAGGRPRREAIDAARVELEQRLNGEGPLHERYISFRRRHALAPAQVLPAFRAAVAACRERVRSEIPLPSGERVVIEAGPDVALEARAVYLGGLTTEVRVNISGPTDLARILWLAAHETYPGHHLQHVLAERDLVQARGWFERQLYPTFGPHLLYAEGAADAGAALLLQGDTFEAIVRELARAFGGAASVSELIAVHRAVAALDEVIPGIARGYLGGELSSEVATAKLTEEALVADAAQFLFVIERQRTRVLAYPVGRRVVEAELSALPTAQRWSRLAEIASHLSRGRPTSA